MTLIQTERIKLWGIVQGVGFRPFVAKTAATLGMKGRVLNMGGLVEITLTDTPRRIDHFIETLQANKPEPAEIVHIKREVIDPVKFDSFAITGSSPGGDDPAMIPADLAICSHCLEELYDPENPRYLHPFISCMICGPRYTIIDQIPYDRESTSMVDFPMCPFCKDQYEDLTNRRHHAQTISCHNCGPSLLWKEGPADTGAAPAAPQNAPSQHADPQNAPSQHADPQNAPSQHADPQGAPSQHALTGDQAILDRAASILAAGGVIAFKSVGGYNLVASPLQERAVAKLRKIKNREEKPFAVLFRSLEQIRRFCSVDPVEARLLESSARPILLLERRESAPEPVCPEAAGPAPAALGTACPEFTRSRFIGAFLPSFAAQYLLLDRISPLIFTSANLSDMPMIKDAKEIFQMMARHKDIGGVLYNRRRILMRADDSVARVIDGQPQMIRRSKGYVPAPLYVDRASGPRQEQEKAQQQAQDKTRQQEWESVFAAGGQLKNSFSLTKGPFVYMSQFFGDLDSRENQEIYQESLDHLKVLFRLNPQVVACDLHPRYYTTAFAESYAKAHSLPLIKVQHHHAHVASVMAEHHLKGTVIGVSFDGTGYGTDGCIWGGEFFLCEAGKACRMAHLKYVDMPGGDSSVKSGIHSALAYIHAWENDYLSDGGTTQQAEPGGFPQPQAEPGDKPQGRPDCLQIPLNLSRILAFGRERILSLPEATLILKALETGVNTIKSSSMGRLFDAVSALLGIKDHNDYEGQCAILLEDAAAFAQKYPGRREVCDLALEFHQQIIDLILDRCRWIRSCCGVNQVALTGGTFQNKILMEGTLKLLRAEGFQPYYNVSVSPNDGGLALGQAYIAMHRQL